MARAAVAEGFFTFLFTDIVGSTALWERAPEAARRAVARHNELVGSVIAQNHGELFKIVGDACCCVFRDPSAAVAAAISLQRALGSERWPDAVGSMHVRMGIHSGNAFCDAGDYFGPTLNRVSRLMHAAHGGQILASSATAELVSRTLPQTCSIVDLGAHRLRDLAEAQHLFQIRATGLLSEFPPVASLDSKPNNLPSQLASFVGRVDDLQHVRELLLENRLVTICGAGGIGKTRLALQIAADTIGAYADGSWFIRLADVTESSLVAQTIATTLHIAGVPGQAFQDVLMERLRDKKLFLLLDNSEHVLPGTAALASALLKSCPHIKILVTSRESLHVTGEAVIRIGPLSITDACSLFVRRANLSSADDYVRHVCENLDRVPLAIELAAGRMGALSTKQLHDRLKAILPVLASKDPSQEARHRTLRATMEWSYRLLNPEEQRFFAMLAVFEGGFALEACEALVSGVQEAEPAFVLLDALIDKSFVSAEPVGNSMRYRLLDFLHRFAREKLNERERDSCVAQEAHFNFFKDFADGWGAWASDEDERSYIDAFERELPNMRAALEWSLKQPERTAGLELLMKVLLYWQQHCNIAEARAWLRRALHDWDGTGDVLHARLLRRAATFATIEDDYTTARELTRRASESFEQLGDRAGLAEAVHNLAVIEQRSGSQDQALDLYRDALSIFEETGHEIGMITASYNIALVYKHRNELPQSKMYLNRGMALCSSPQHAGRLGTFRMLRGELAMREGDLDEAAASFQHALAIKRDLHDRHDEVEALCNISVLEIRRGNWNAARQTAAQALLLARELDLASLYIACFELGCAILLHLGDVAAARKLMAVAKGMRGERGYVYGIMDEIKTELAAIDDVEPAAPTPDDVRRAADELRGYLE
jgi:predicted ATPase/class 3 adenylate cyclase/Tfp pilus assembly protein PilF